MRHSITIGDAAPADGDTKRAVVREQHEDSMPFHFGFFSLEPLSYLLSLAQGGYVTSSRTDLEMEIKPMATMRFLCCDPGSAPQQTASLGVMWESCLGYLEELYPHRFLGRLYSYSLQAAELLFAHQSNCLDESSYNPGFPGQPPLWGTLSGYPVKHLLVALPAKGSIHITHNFLLFFPYATKIQHI
ncbi:hypothetical protein EK904_009727 [Melospiza melodia maxima]|nr:hypothetical protein EK904_009727 [Melospiza melodia maxima]